MVYALHKLKKKLEDPTLAEFFKATAHVEVEGSEVHQPHGSDKDSGILELTLEDIFKYDYSRECMDQVRLFLPGCQFSEPSSFLQLLEDLTSVEDHEDLLLVKPDRDFAPLFRVVKSFARAPESRWKLHPVRTWLNLNRSYPVSASKIIDIIFDAFKKVASDYVISEPESPLSGHSGALPSRFCRVTKEQHEKEIAEPARVICELPEFASYEVMSVAAPEDAAIFALLNGYTHTGTQLIALPPYLANLGVSNGWLSTAPKNLARMERTPSGEDLMTIDSLLGSGMSLAQAVQSATKLN